MQKCFSEHMFNKVKLCIITMATAATTHRPMITTTKSYTQDTQCQACSGPVQICEKLHHTKTCHYPDNLCLNHIINSDSGARTVDRRCSNHQTCHREWSLGSSNSTICKTFHQGHIYTLRFECTYCCTEDGCNVKLHPEQATLMG